MMDLKQHIRAIPDFPKPGILFYDISTLLAHPKAWHATVERLADAVGAHRPALLNGVESHGFLVTAALAVSHCGGLPVEPQDVLQARTTANYTYDRAVRS